MNSPISKRIVSSGPEIVERVFENFGNHLGRDEFGLAMRLYDTPLAAAAVKDNFSDGVWYGYQAEQSFYPASVSKLFYLAAFFGFTEAGNFTPTQEDERARDAMIRVSSNDATTYLFNRLTNTYGGEALDDTEMEEWCFKRRCIEEWFKTWPNPSIHTGIRLRHSTFDEGPYGREYKSRQLEGANMLTPLAAASLMHDIAASKAVSMQSSASMMRTLTRDWQRMPGHVADASEDQVKGFLSERLPAIVRCWSKAGHTSTCRHDVLYCEHPNGRSAVICVFSSGRWSADNQRLLPSVADEVYSLLVTP
ncbi:serine hydrolase [Phyllobacterium myrsinacearum]|uniref:beta-lactamase n=1 Tax=Phyllobacterium myrsinacearum TaxID=28101 RepID=A0A839ELB8_9HYPH|nr:serine hydrolase [Phyllobacterium myrsinacearum]MBA8879005.1 beta-lactamase class A [Phyllobacterium myrsinacearum]